MSSKTTFVMNALLVGFLLLNSLQVSGQTTENNNICPHIVVASPMAEVELCQYSTSMGSKFNLTLEKLDDRNESCLLYNSGSELKLQNRTNKTQCHFFKMGGTFFLSLINIEKENAGNYICYNTKIFPPPFKNSIVNRTLLYVLENSGKPSAYPIYSFVETWVLIGISVFLFVCFMVLLFISSKKKASFNQHCRECKARNIELTKEQNGEYMHMASVPLARCKVR
ncbi:uncharacterized protein [Engystomops pustulosus]|uniref:uncharacterized protein n=1 Tax=Engystomops pustulosus TaxID=76066 RepID=UPI003AFACD13